MRISSSWLAEFVVLPPPDELAQLFEMAGIGVESRHSEAGDEHWSLEVTSNRGDWLSATGLAREVSAMTGALRHTPPAEVAEAGELLTRQIAVAVEDSEDCPRYVARLIEDLRVGDSPPWLQERLHACGLRPISNVVDITNYVMLETGQPLHAFDADKIAEQRIVVRRAGAGEKLVTLDGVERSLTEDVLVIADARRPIGVAGIMGGQDSEVTASTRRVVLESAHFAPARVRRGARALGLATEASRRFERWVDPNATAHAADRAAGLLEKYAAARVARGTIDLYPRLINDAVVDLRVERCNQLLGLRLTADEIASFLRRLGLAIVSHDEAALRVGVPTWRRDIALPVDCIEEVARLYGYDKIPASLPAGSNPSAGLSLAQHPEQKARSVLLRCGLNEVVTLSLENAAAVERAGLAAEEDAVILRNPLSDDFTRLRTSLLPSMLPVLAANSRKYQRAVGLFELGKTYHGSGAAPASQPAERRQIAVAMAAGPPPRHWQQSAQPTDFFSLKAVVDRLLRELTALVPVYTTARHPALHPGRTAAVTLDRHEVACLGEVHPDVAQRYEMQQRAYIALIDLEALLPHVELVKSCAPLQRHPAAERDLAVVVQADVPAAAVEAVILAAGAPLLESAGIFDVYTGKPVAAGFKSLALSLSFRGEGRTLEDAEVDAAMAAIVDAAQSKLAATVRA